MSLNPSWLDRVFLGRPADTSDDHESELGNDSEAANDHVSPDRAADRQERRLTLLESAVMGMTEKFDEFLSIVNPEQLSWNKLPVKERRIEKYVKFKNVQKSKV